jgi:hypothetical protein
MPDSGSNPFSHIEDIAARMKQHLVFIRVFSLSNMRLRR